MILLAKGILHFDEELHTNKQKAQNWKKFAAVELSCDIDNYYRWLLSRRFGVRLLPPFRGPHITVISEMIGRDITEEAYSIIKKKYNNKEVSFEYEVSPKSDGNHWWLRIHSNDINFIRKEAGLGKPYWGLHLSLGYPHPKFVAHTNYIYNQCLKFNI